MKKYRFKKAGTKIKAPRSAASKKACVKTMRIDLMSNISHHVPVNVDLNEAKNIPDQPRDNRGKTASGVSKYHDLLNSLYEAVIITDLKGQVLDLNRRALDFFGFSQHEHPSGSITELIIGLRTEILSDILSHLKAERFSLLSACCARKDGSHFPTETAVSLFTDNEETYLCFFVRDITVRLELETQLAQSKKLESIGLLAAGIAHEVNTPIQFLSDNNSFISRKWKEAMTLLDLYRSALRDAAVSGSLPAENMNKIEAMEDKLMDDDDITQTERALSQSAGGIDRIASIVTSLKEFAHPSRAYASACDIHRAIRNAVTVSRNAWKYVAEIEFDLDPDMPTVMCFPDEFSQVILNLILNSRDAITDAVENSERIMGTISISTSHDRNWAEIRVDDDGVGIPDDVMPLIFDPFFTTKEVGKGSGQGLAIVHNVIVNKHCGEIKIESQQGKGTCAIIRLPLNQQSQPDQQPEEEQDPA